MVQTIYSDILNHKLVNSNFYKDLGYKINFCDIGASVGVGLPWSLFDTTLINIIGFEPDSAEYKKLVDSFPHNIYYNIGLWSKPAVKTYFLTQQDFYGNFAFGTSSMYQPNSPKLSLNYGTIDKGRVVERETKVQCDSFDNIFETMGMPKPDFIKIDTQGSEYEILKGAENVLSQNAPLVTLETWTEEIYKNAPLMHEIMSLMHKYGYKLHYTTLAASRYYKTPTRVHCLPRCAGFELFYVKNYEELYVLTEEQLIKQIAILELFGFRDYAFFLLENLGIIREDLKVTIANILIENGKYTEQKYSLIRY